MWRILFLTLSCLQVLVNSMPAHEFDTAQTQQLAEQQPVKTGIPTDPGAYYESTKGFVALAEFSPFMLMKGESRLRAPLIPNKELSFIIVYTKGDSQLDYLRLLRSSRMTITFGVTTDESGST